uniref:BTB/POZ domain-containing protein 16 n=1 Tax=Vombatus ursinus TaxID=29139 RepID=A0A4X2LIG5_VOMUR
KQHPPRLDRRISGLNNRWRFPREPYLGDLLGLSQLSRATGVDIDNQLKIIDRKNLELKIFLNELKRKNVTLDCMGFKWELHQPQLFHSGTLTKLYMFALSQKNTDPLKELEKFLRGILASDPRSRGLSPGNLVPPDEAVFCLLLPTAFATALKSLYTNETEVHMEDVLGVLASANILQFPTLFKKCVSLMKDGISPCTIQTYYLAACKYKEELLITACEKWLEMNLVPLIGKQIYLRTVPQELLQKVLKSHRLFTFSEFDLLKTTLYWVYLQLNLRLQSIPIYEAVLAFFNSFPKKCPFLERELGQKFLPVFHCLRLHGITKSKDLEDIKYINFFPEAWMVRILANHYHALESGGDMFHAKDLSTQAIRFGLLINQIYSEMIGVYGFFFEIKGIKHGGSSYSFYMQRIKYSDTNIPTIIHERSTVSLRQERIVKYEIRAQSLVDGNWQEFSTNTLTQKFGLIKSTSKSHIDALIIIPFYR